MFQKTKLEKDAYLMTQHDSGFGAIIIVQETFLVATLAIRSPNRLLWVISLEHVSPLHLHGDDEVGCRIGVRLPRLAELDVAGHLGKVLSHRISCYGAGGSEKNKCVFLICQHPTLYLLHSVSLLNKHSALSSALTSKF